MCSGTIPSEQPLTITNRSYRIIYEYIWIIYESYLSFVFSWSVNLCSPRRHVQPLEDQGHLYGTAVDDLQLSDLQYLWKYLRESKDVEYIWIHLLLFIKFKTIIKDIKDDWRTLKVSKVCDSPHSSMDTNFTTRFASSGTANICHLPGLWSRRFSIGFHKVLQPPSHLALRSRLRLQMLKDYDRRLGLTEVPKPLPELGHLSQLAAGELLTS